MNATVFLLVFLFVSSTAAAASSDLGHTSQARAELQPSGDEGITQASIRNQSYDLVRIQMGPDRTAWTTLLLHRQQDVVTNMQFEGFQKKELLVEAFKVEGTKKTKLFRFKEKASGSHIDEALGILVAKNYGCCASTDAHAVYSLQNGKRLFFVGGDRDPYIFSVAWPNTDRFGLVGIHISDSERDAEIYKEPAKKTKTRSLMVSWASKTELLDQVSIEFDDGDMHPAVTAIEWVASDEMKVRERTLDVWPPEGAKPVPVPTIRITLATGQKILIPFDGDRIGKLKAPKDVTSTRPTARPQ